MNKSNAIQSPEFAAFLAAYTQALLWSSTDTTPDGRDVNLDEFDLSTAGSDTCRADCLEFFAANYADLCAAADVYGFDHAGHDFALTRNHHGAGFWDRGLGELGERLTEAAHAVGECWPYLGDDGSVYL